MPRTKFFIYLKGREKPLVWQCLPGEEKNTRSEIDSVLETGWKLCLTDDTKGALVVVGSEIQAYLEIRDSQEGSDT